MDLDFQANVCFLFNAPWSLAPVVEVDLLPFGQVIHQRAWAGGEKHASSKHNYKKYIK